MNEAYSFILPLQFPNQLRQLTVSALLTINVQNSDPQTQYVYFFQQPAIYTSAAYTIGGDISSNSLGSAALTSGSFLTFQIILQNYACIQELIPYQYQSQSYYASTIIDLATSSGSGNDWTTAEVSSNSLSFSKPVNGSGVQEGAFRITTPNFPSPPYYNIGSGVDTAVGTLRSFCISNFVQAIPQSNTDCQPVLKFYVQIGTYRSGAFIDFSQSSINAALCDFTGGYTIANVTLESNGEWDVQLQ